MINLSSGELLANLGSFGSVCPSFGEALGVSEETLGMSEEALGVSGRVVRPPTRPSARPPVVRPSDRPSAMTAKIFEIEIAIRRYFREVLIGAKKNK